MKKRICAFVAAVAASVLLASPASADGPKRHPMVPNEMPRIIHVEPTVHCFTWHRWTICWRR